MADDKPPAKVLRFERPRRFPADLDRLRARIGDENVSFEESDIDEGLAIAEAAIERGVPGGHEAKTDLLNIRAHRTLAAGDTDAALAKWADIAAAYPTYFHAYAMRADILGKRGDHDGALAELDAYVERAPTDARGYLQRANVYNAQGDGERALANFRRAVVLDPSSTEAKLGLAQALAAKGDAKGAARAYAKAAEEVLGNAESYDMRGLMHFVCGQEELALADYEASLALDPTNADTVAWRGLLRSRLGRREEALADFTRLIAMRPAEARGYWRRGEVLLHLGKPAEALRDLDRALALGGDERGAAHAARGMAQEALGDADGALASYEAALSRDPANIACRSRRFQIYNAREDWERCMIDIEAVLAKTPDDPPLLQSLARLQHRVHRRDEALATYDRVIALDPRNAEVYAERSALHTGIGNTMAAHADMAKAYELAPDDRDIRSAHGRFAAQVAPNEEARSAAYALIVSAAELEPENPEAWARAAYDLRGAGSPERALPCITRAVELDPDNPEYLHERAGCLDVTAPREETDPEGFRAAMEAALADVEKALELTDDEEFQWELYRTRGDLRESLGDLAGAIADATHLIEATPDRVDGYTERARLLKQTGDMEGARADAAKVKLLEDELIAELSTMSGMENMPNLKRFDLDEV
jgi:tetratricopeptide (TPR) repeat protein